MGKIVINTGGTSGIGLETARFLANKGCKVYELSRRENGTDVAVHIQANVTDENQVRNAVESILRQERKPAPASRRRTPRVSLRCASTSTATTARTF